MSSFRGMPSPGETDAYERVLDLRRPRARVVSHERGGSLDVELWLVELPEPVRWERGRTRTVVVDFCLVPEGYHEALALPSTPKGAVLSWHELSRAVGDRSDLAMLECVRQLGWEVDRG